MDAQPISDSNIPVAPIAINAIEIQPIIINGQPVLTLAMIDKIHQRPEGTAGRNFRENKSRLIESKHYFQISSDEIRRNNPKAISTASKRKDVIVITEYGYLLLVKSLTDDLAWKIQEQLIECYFRAGSPNVLNQTAEALTSSEQRTIQELVQYKTTNIDPTSRRKAIAEIYSRLGHKFRVAKYSQIPRAQFAEAITYIMEMTLKASAHKKTPPQNTLGEAGSYLIEQYSLALKQLLKHQDTTITTTIADHIQQKYGQPIRHIPTTEANLIFASLETLLTNAMRAWLLCSNIERWVIAEWEGHKTDMPNPIRQVLQTNNHYDPNALSISRNINQQAIQMITTQPQLTHI
ncbi:ORF6N domain-containing protein [Aquaspirillum soli]